MPRKDSSMFPETRVKNCVTKKGKPHPISEKGKRELMR